jgi:hypothetical protein
MRQRDDYHLSYFGPCLPHWPRGGWSVYNIDGDQIAERIVFTGEWPHRSVVRRDSWCGYLGIWETLQEATEAIAKDKAERAEAEARQAQRKRR